MYRCLEQTNKFTLPPSELNEIEHQLWKESEPTNNDTLDEEMSEKLMVSLGEIRETGVVSISLVGNAFLSIGSMEERREFLRAVWSENLSMPAIITCITKLPRSVNEEESIDLLVLGTEQNMIYVVSIEKGTVLDKV